MKFNHLAIVFLGLCLLCVTGCKLRGSSIHENSSVPQNQELHPFVAAAKAQGEIEGEMHVLRLSAMAGFLVSMVATFILRAFVPGLAVVGGCCAGGFLAVFAVALITSIAAPFILWSFLTVLVLSVAAVAWHFRKWILSPDAPAQPDVSCTAPKV